jgi:hypothetical protein
MLELEIDLKLGPKIGLGIENKGFQFPYLSKLDIIKK